ncbi:MAG TPA: DUF2911 domain-containing protein [Bryobacteraceae bacterium]|nr:DUF2911 domain-containing protein [Bryobacteraceae bacterium]
MSKFTLISAMLLGLSAFAFASNPQSPAAETKVTINGKTIAIKYSAPSVRGRKIFGPGGLVSKDPTYPVWRTGADSATALHTDADLMIGSLSVPAGDYTVFTQVDKMRWELIINKQTKQWGLSYNKAMDLGRVEMTTNTAPSLTEQLKITLSDAGGGKGKLEIAWENIVASVTFTAK